MLPTVKYLFIYDEELSFVKLNTYTSTKPSNCISLIRDLFNYFINNIVIMSCLLCLEVNDNAFDLNGAEGLRLNAKYALQQHFQFCFEVSASS